MVLYPIVGLHWERIPRVKLPRVESVSMIAHGILPQCETLLGKLEEVPQNMLCISSATENIIKEVPQKILI